MLRTPATKVEEEYNNCIFALTLAQKGADEGVVNAEMYKALDSLISAAHAEGVAEGAERCRQEILVHSQFMLERHGYFVPASVLAPTKEKPERGKPSQALLDELSDICGEKVEYEPSVLAPTKETP